MSDLSPHAPCPNHRLARHRRKPASDSGSVFLPHRVMACALVTLLFGLGACGEKSSSGNAAGGQGKTTASDGFPENYVPPAPEGQFTDMEEVVDRGKNLVRYKVQITNSNAFPKKWFKGAPDLPPVGGHSTASRCVIEVVDPANKVLQQFAEAERDLRMPVWFAARPGASIPETVRVVIHDRQTKQRYQSEPIELPRPEPTDEEVAAITAEEEAPAASNGQVAGQPASKDGGREKPGEVEYVKADAKDKDVGNLAGKHAEVTATIAETRRTKGSEHLVVLCEGKRLMFFCPAPNIAAVFGEGDPLEKLQPGTRLKVRGKITLYNKRPQIVLKSADQLVEIKAGEGDKAPRKEQAAKSGE